MYLPLIQLDYHLATDLNGVLTGGTRQRLGLTAFHLTGVEGAGTLTDATLEVSYNEGTTWTPVTLSRAGSQWTTDVQLPKDASHLSLRATTSDNTGNKITQEVIRATSIR